MTKKLVLTKYTNSPFFKLEYVHLDFLTHEYHRSLTIWFKNLDRNISDSDNYISNPPLRNVGLSLDYLIPAYEELIRRIQQDIVNRFTKEY